QFVVSGGYAASDSSLPAKMNVGTPDEIIVAPHGDRGERKACRQTN
ncbi:hypothetical protein P3T16_007003, partial [Paraburkholderia sp. GAS42]